MDPADERPTICRHLLTGDGGPAGPGDQVPEWQPPLNLVSITLILVSAFVILVLALLLVARMRRARWCCFSVMRAMESCELPERSVGLARHHHHHQTPSAGGGLLRQHSGGEAGVRGGGETVYLPLAMHIEPRRDEPRHLAVTEGLVRGSTPDTEPPPAYHDLFPAGYKFSPYKIEEEEEEQGASHGLVLSSLLKDEAEAAASQEEAASPQHPALLAEAGSSGQSDSFGGSPPQDQRPASR